MRESKLDTLLRDIRTTVRTLRDTNIFPVKELCRQAIDFAGIVSRAVEEERKRRRGFGAHLELVGDEILVAFAESDFVESKVMDTYLEAVHNFATAVGTQVCKLMSAQISESQTDSYICLSRLGGWSHVQDPQH